MTHPRDLARDWQPEPVPVAPVVVAEPPKPEATEAMEWDLNVVQAARLLNLHRQSVYKLAREGRVPTRRVLGQWRFSSAWLREWVDSGGAA